MVQWRYCDQQACSGPYIIWQRSQCGGGGANGSGSTCESGKCLTHAGPPASACSVATDCGLPPTVCVADEQLIFSDPSCDDGQCHWKEIVNSCGMNLYDLHFICRGGTCSSIAPAQTGGPVMPMPFPDPMQPPPAPDQACTATTDCTKPPPTCFHDSVVSYVRGVCRAGACSWDVNLDECIGTCGNGACVAP